MLSIETRVFRLDEIKPSAYNPRVELNAKDREFIALKESIDHDGLVLPLVVNIRDNTIIGGHQRYNVLLAEGAEETEAVVVDLDDAHAKALCLALNKLDGDWDYGNLADILTELREAGADFAQTGFSQSEIEELIGALVEESKSVDIRAGADPDEDSEAEEQAEAEPAGEEGVKCAIGVYSFTLTADEFENLIADVREKVGFTKPLVIAELRRRIFR